jgi:hypothetical protein
MAKFALKKAFLLLGSGRAEQVGFLVKAFLYDLFCSIL